MHTMTHKSIVLSAILLAMAACSKQDVATAPMPESIPGMTAPQANSVTGTESHTPTLKNVVQDDSGKTVLYWYDPMYADRHFDKPGKSPFMDMELVPKYAESGKP